MFISIKDYYDREVAIDDAEGNVVLLPVQIKRFNVEQLQAFSSGMKRCENRAADRYLSRKPDGDEQEREPIVVGGTTYQGYRVSDAEVRRRRLLEMTTEQREQFERLDAEDEKFIAAFYVDSIRQYVSVKPGVKLMFDAQGETRQLSTGVDLVAAFAGNAAILGALTRAINEENTLSAQEKKRLRLLSASMSSSPASPLSASGDGPAVTAAPVNAKDSAANGPVMDASQTSPSGTTET